jgi:putative transcription antitermination factor YqgF
MKHYLAIDYGTTYFGLAWADGPLAEPMDAWNIKDLPQDQVIDRVQQVVDRMHIEAVVLGWPTGKMQAPIQQFGQALQQRLQIPVHWQDEANSSIIARSQTKQAGKRVKQLGKQEHGQAAAVILQEYLDSL